MRDESFAKIESDRTHVDCSVEITANQSGICSCQSIALAFNLGDRDRDRILSDALRHCRQNHLLERTGEWLFGSDTFKKWREMSRSSILWVVAFPGMGKSMLSSAVLEMLDTNRNLGDIVTFFFCDGRFKAGDWILGVLSNLVCELLSRNANQQSEDRLTALAMDLANIEDGLSSQELRCFLSVIQHSLKPHETLFLVLDGFDDTLDGQSGHDLVHTFLDFSNSSNTRHRIKIFVSSSPNYSPCLNLGSVLRVDIDQEPFARVDLHAYVRRGVQNLQLSDPSQDFKNTAELLSSNRNSTFLSAGLTLRNLSKGSSPLNVLTHIWDTSPSCFLSKIYKDMLNRIVEKDRMRSLFKWIVYSARPLSLEELDYALQPATGPSERDICAASGGLLTIGKSQTVNFLHLTARDYLLSLSEGDVYWMGKPSMAHEMIAQTCLKALSPVELLQCLDLLTQGNHPGNTHQHTKFTYARHYLIFHYMLGEPHSHSLPGLIHHSLKRSMESEDFKVHAHSVAELQEIQLNTVRSCGSTASQCMISRMILEVAADLGFEKLARLELQMGGDAHLSCKHSSRAALHPIHLAARGGHLNVVKLLLEYGADLTTLSNSGQTPLFYAIAKGSPDIMRLLLTHEIKPSSASFTNKEPSLLSCATQRTIQHMCELFLVARISDICTQCTDKQPHYIVSFLCFLSTIHHLNSEFSPFALSANKVVRFQCHPKMIKTAIPGLQFTSRVSPFQARKFPFLLHYGYVQVIPSYLTARNGEKKRPSSGLPGQTCIMLWGLRQGVVLGQSGISFSQRITTQA